MIISDKMSSIKKLSRVDPLQFEEVVECCTSEDLVIHCADGTIRSHQWLFSQHSPFLKKLFLRFQVVEFVFNLNGELEPDSMRKGDTDLEIILKDFNLDDVKTLIKLFAGKQLKFTQDKLGRLRELLNLLQCDKLDIPSANSRQVTRKETPESAHCVSIKTEVLDCIQMKHESTPVPEESTPVPEQSSTVAPGQKDGRTCDTPGNKVDSTCDAPGPGSQQPSSSKQSDLPQGKKKSLKRKTQIARRTSKPEMVVYSDKSCLIWEDIPCIICGEEIQVRENMTKGNRSRYQHHLLGHFQQTIFSEFQENEFKCQHNDCNYFGETQKRAGYVKHIAFQHKEWYTRIDARIQELSLILKRDEETEEELKEWKQIKKFFQQDLRIRPTESTNYDSEGECYWSTEKVSKPNKTTVKEQFDDHLQELSQLEELSVQVEEPSIDIRKNEIMDPDQVIEEGAESTRELQVPPTNQVIISPASDKSHKSNDTSIDEFDSASQVAMKILETVDIQDDMDTEMEVTEEGEGSTLQTEIRFCHFCDQVLDRSYYVDHMVELHCRDTLFGDITGTRCSVDLCGRNFESSAQLCLHMVHEHEELIPRIDKHTKDLRRNSLCEAEESPMLKLFLDLREACLERQQLAKAVAHGSQTTSSYALPSMIAPATERSTNPCSLENLVPPEFIGCSVDTSSSDRDDSIKDDSIKASEEGKKSNSSSEVSYVTATCTPGSVPPVSEKVVSSAASSLVSPPHTKSTSGGAERCSTISKPVLEKSNVSLPLERFTSSLSTAAGPSTSSSKIGGPRPSSVVMENIFLRTKENLGFKCLMCSLYSSTKPDILGHIIENHMAHMFKEIPVQEEYKCAEHDLVFKTRVGMMSHNLLKHLNTFGEARDYMVNLIGTVNFGSQVGSSEVGRDENSELQGLLQKEIKQEIIRTELNPILDTDQSILSWSCKECSQEFSDEESIRKHVVLEHLMHHFDSLVPLDKKIYQCTYCHEHASTDRKQHILHLSSVHSVIEEEKIYGCIKESRTLLLDIDVIRCRCGKNFNSETERDNHIISLHFKDKFSNIPKRCQAYKCDECGELLAQRSLLIKHLVTAHKYITSQEMGQFIPGRGGQDPLPFPGENGTEIDFNDSVSQLHLQRVNQQRKRMLALSVLLKCPICDKMALNQTNFEDHLVTHEIRQEPVFQCLVCNFAGSFAQHFHHIQQVHKESDDVRIKCLCCLDKKSACLTSDRDLANHSQTYVHTVKASKFDLNLLYFTFRYSCVMCLIYFKSLEDLEDHLAKAPDHKQVDRQKEQEPSLMCHLCNMQKPASKFAQHMRMNRHIHMVEQEAALHPAEYGLAADSVLYSCETCRCAANYQLIRDHLKASCKKVKCGPCDEVFYNASSQTLREALRKHVHSDKHKSCVAEFSSLPTNKFNSKYMYQCVTCFFVFCSLAALNDHNSTCPKTKFRCLTCDTESSLSDWMSHVVSQSHMDNVAKITPVDTESGTLLVDLGQSPRGSPSPANSEELEILEASPEPDIIEEEVVTPKKRARNCETVVLDETPLPSSSSTQSPRRHYPPSSSSSSSSSTHSPRRQHPIVLPSSHQQHQHNDQAAVSPTVVLEAESVIQIPNPSMSMPPPTRTPVRSRGARNLGSHPNVNQSTHHPTDPSVVEVIDEDVQEVQELDQEEVQEVQEMPQEIQEVQEVQEVSQEVDSNQFKKPTAASPGRVPVIQRVKARKRPRNRNQPPAGNIRGGVGAYPDQSQIQTETQRALKRRKMVFKCNTEGCTVQMNQDNLRNHAISHLRRAHEVRIKCTACHVTIEDPGQNILVKLSNHVLNVRHKRSTIIQPGARA